MSERLLEATLRGDGQTVADIVAAAHTENTSIIKYSDENSMACVPAIAYYYAHGDYIFHREFQTGKGFADLVLIPRKKVAKPAIIVELKYGHSADEAISQIKERRYWEKVSEYSSDNGLARGLPNGLARGLPNGLARGLPLLLVGISYDKETKTHQCKIETLPNKG